MVREFLVSEKLHLIHQTALLLKPSNHVQHHRVLSHGRMDRMLFSDAVLNAAV